MRRLLAALCFCAIAALAAASGHASVAVEDEQVVFRLADSSAAAVYVVGDFNGWNPTIDLMEKGAGGFEISLYLLPGTYRYRFVVDGASKPDPDNACIDAEGNSCFTLFERSGALRLVTAEKVEGGETGGTLSRLSPSGRIDLAAIEGSALIIPALGLGGVIDERIDIDFSAAFTEELSEGDAPSGWSYLLRAEGAYRFEKGSLGAFTRPARDVDLGDFAGLIGTVGPYRYPASLFSRGASLEAALPFGLGLDALYLSRLRGYSSGLEGTPDSSDIFSSRDLLDSDTYGIGLGAKLAGASIRYLYRGDRRPKDSYWQFPGGDGPFYEGFERDEFQGLSLSFAGDAGFGCDVEAIFGKSFLDATGMPFTNEEGHADLEDVSYEQTWEHGHRVVFGVTKSGTPLGGSFRFEQTTLEGDPAARDGRPDGSRTVFAAGLSAGDSSSFVGLSVKGEQYSSSNTGSVFWLSRTNFWLDGDEVTYDLIPFLSSRNIYEIGFTIGLSREPLGASPWEKGVRLTVTQRGDVSGAEPLFREMRISGGMNIHPRVAVLADVRGASYRYGGTERSFADAFLALHGEITKRLWCALGTGVNPCSFDRWLSSFADHGREDYLYDHGVFSALAAGGEAASMKALLNAEDALADDWVVSFQAGFTF